MSLTPIDPFLSDGKSAPETTLFEAATGAFSHHLRLAETVGGAQESASDLAQFLRTAAAIIERRLGLSLFTRRFRWEGDRWPPSAREGTIAFPIAPVQSVQSVTVAAADGTLSVWEANSWILESRSEPARLYAGQNAFVPLEAGAYFTIVFSAGFGATYDSVPSDLRRAMLLLAAHCFEHRYAAEEEFLSPIPFGVATLLTPWRRLRLGGRFP